MRIALFQVCLFLKRYVYIYIYVAQKVEYPCNIPGIFQTDAALRKSTSFKDSV